MWQRCFFVKIARFLRKSILLEQLRWLLLRRLKKIHLHSEQKYTDFQRKIIQIASYHSLSLSLSLSLYFFTIGNYNKKIPQEAVAQRCSVKRVILEIVQNSQENTCARVSFSIKLQTPATLLKRRLWHRCLPANFAKLLRTFFFHRSPTVAASVP